MKSLEKMKNILVIGERSIFKELSQIISIALKANSTVKDMFKENYQEEILSKEMEDVRELEKKSDKVAFKVGEDITSGAISPNIIDNLIECSHTADDIVDLYYYISRELNRMSKTHSIDFKAHQEASWTSVYESLLNLAETSLQKLGKMLATSNESEISKLRREIEELEEQGDEIKDQGFDKLYSLAPKISYLQFYHYSEILHKCDDILDSCEDTSQLIMSIVTSILK
jgi:uncharacterized protein